MKWIRSYVILALFCILRPCTVHGQYQLYDWINFEKGSMPSAAHVFGTYAGVDQEVVQLNKLPGAAGALRDLPAQRETGNFGLLLRADPRTSQTRDFLMGLTVGNVLDRAQLQPGQRALFQMDFFAPPKGTDMPELAVLAADPEDRSGPGQVPRAFYRFGVRNNGVFYSRVLPDQNTDYHQDSNLLARLPRPGWHRLAIVLEGSETIRCYIDGIQPSFSPVKDSAITRLQVGVMLAEDRRWYDSYVDNLSIQFGQDADLPESPYRVSWGAPAAAPAPASPINWQEPGVAWANAQRANKPLLLYFSASTSPVSRRLDKILESTPEAAAVLARYSCARIDANSLAGGSIARQYEVFRVPTFLLISPVPKELARELFTNEDTWASFAARLPK